MHVVLRKPEKISRRWEPGTIPRALSAPVDIFLAFARYQDKIAEY